VSEVRLVDEDFQDKTELRDLKDKEETEDQVDLLV